MCRLFAAFIVLNKILILLSWIYADPHLLHIICTSSLNKSTPKVIAMSFIPCTQNCKFQDEGLCTLAQTQVMGQAVPNDTCLNFTPRLSNQHSNSLTNVANPDQV